MKRLSKLTSVTLVLALMLSILSVAQPAKAAPDLFANPTTTVFINEIHYDNTGTDAGEAIEIAGPAGTNLTGWSIVLYNGSGGATYDTDMLSGTIPNQQGGYGTVVLTYPSNGIQNGAPDGLALVDASNTVVQFLSYEGSFTAVGGAANGMTSTDIGISQTGSEPVGSSLQLTGSGATYGDFTWAATTANTFGSPNTGQTFTGGGGSTDPTGTGSATPATVAPGESSLLAVVVTPGSNPASTGLAVVCDLSTIGGSATQSFFDDGSNGDTAAGDNTFSFLATVDSGTSEGAKNLSCTITDAEARTGNAAISLTVQEPVEIVINEILADPDAVNGDANGDGVVNTSQDEFVEIVNNEPTALNISGWTLSDAVGVRHTFPTGTVIPAGCSVVVFAGGAPTGTFGRSLVQVSTTGQLGLNNTGDTVTLKNGSLSVAGYVYGSEGGDNQSLTRDPDVTGGEPLVKHATATGSGGALQSPGRKIDGSQFPGCPAEVKIHEVQGSGATSPLVGKTVVIEGIVVGDFQDGASGTNGDFNGFHVQEEDADVDGNALTSEGIFVFDGNFPAVNVAIGDLVEVQGVVSEFNGLTEITSFTGVKVLGNGNPLPTAATLSLPVTAVTDFEAYEGMRVTFPQALVISEYFNFDRFGEIVLTSERHLTPTAEFEPGAPAIQAAQEFLLDRITLDDGRSTQNPDPAIHPNGGVFNLSNFFRGGDTVANVTGIMDFSFNLYRIQPTQGADYVPANPRPTTPEDVGGRLTVASMNTLNFFLTLDYPAGNPLDNKCGPLQNVECRGADFDQPNEFTRQRAKLLAALAGLNADVVGLNELENTLGVDPLGDPTNGVVAGLNDIFTAGTYAYIDTGVIGSDAIRVGLIYKPSKVMPVGDFKILDSTVDSRFLDTLNRPVLAQTFEEVATGARFTVVVNHLKSKGSDCNAVGDPDMGDGQGNCNLTRKAAAEALVDWLATDPTGSNDADFLIIGDLNSYDKEDPIDAIKEGSDDVSGTGDDYTDLAFHFQGEDAYSYVFDGQTGYLDYALANASLFRQVTGLTDWHINADEADLIDYDTSFKLPAQDAIYAPDAYRSSDHDPVIIGLELDPPFPTASILDDFNRANGNLGSNWKGFTGSYRISGNQVDVRRDGPIYWKDAFGADQEVFVTLTNVDAAGWEQDLLLKVQNVYGPNWGDGVIEVLYDAAANRVTVWTFRPQTFKWFKYADIPVTYANGDQFGARALATGDVVIFKNGVEVGRVTLNAADQAFFNPRGGHIGLWFIDARNAFFDDFGGGDMSLP
ncbi:MAG: ExeM/NucH family extracellular endonuclease [Anaerolineales bacterium]|nr:ExeM/NucH family extracellular endonuclease [Anaerolineales bacterium]